MPSETIPTTQHAAVFHKKGGPVTIEEVPVVQPKDLKPNEALVKVMYSGVCHTDLHAMLGDWPLEHKFPLIGGHEGAGYLAAIGEHSDTNLKIGDAVGIKWLADSCLKCDYCRQGFEPLCKSAQCSGFSVDISFQQCKSSHLLSPSPLYGRILRSDAVSFTRHLTPIPNGIPLDKAAPILCAGVTVYKALKQSGARAGEWVVIPGAGGGLGHLAIQYANYMGLRVIAVDTGAEKKVLCEEMGTDRWIDFKSEKDIVAAIKASTPDGDGPHAAIVTSSDGTAYEQALEYIRPHGTVVAVGLPPDTKVKADVFFTVFLEKHLVGSYVGNRQDAIESLEIAANGKVNMHYDVLPLSELPAVYKKMNDGTLAGRVVLDLWK